MSDSNYKSHANHSSNANYFSDANYLSNANFRCHGMYKTLFCYRMEGGAYMMFNKQLSEEDYKKYRNQIDIDFGKVRWTNAQDILDRLDEKEDTCLGKELKKENDINSLKGAWAPVRDQLDQLTKLEIWDNEAADIVEKITGYDLRKKDEETITIEGKEWTASELKEELNE